MGDYPPEWLTGEIQQKQYERAEWRCEHCGMDFVPGSTKAITARNKDEKPVILTVHHLDGNPANCDWQNLLACCQRCHLHIQGVWKPGGVIPPQWGMVPAWLMARSLPFEFFGFQMEMFERAESAATTPSEND